jgi:hypothetical protein
MTTTTLIAFLTGSSVVASLITGLLKKGLKDISDRWGSLVTQVVLFLVCLVIAALLWASSFVPENIMLVATAIFAGSIAIYEVLYKAILQQLLMGKTQS